MLQINVDVDTCLNLSTDTVATDTLCFSNEVQRNKLTYVHTLHHPTSKEYASRSLSIMGVFCIYILNEIDAEKENYYVYI